MKKAWIALVLIVLLAQPACAGARERSDAPSPAAQTSSVKQGSKARKAAKKSCTRKLRKQGRKVGRGASAKDRAAFKRCVRKKLKGGSGGDEKTSPGGDGGGQPTAPKPTTPKPGAGGKDTLDPGQY